ncbi:MAG TPA: inositol monophosphatase [Bacteroidetes bacterium]|nr:inositol monophosphatase [Bacteroidota bacterium]
MELQNLTQSVISIAKEAGAFIREQYFLFNEKDVQTKSRNNLVSYVDLNAEKILVERLKQVLPESGFITEEKTISQTNSEWQWIIDPLDGTTNFIHGIPAFAVSIGLMQDRKMKAGVVYEIMRDECFSAFDGSKSQLNGKTIYVSERKTLADSLVATGFPYEKYDYLPKYLKALENFMQNTRGIRRIGSAAVDLAYTACGRFDGFFEYNLNAWDVAAGAFIVQQAGGRVTDFSGKENYIFVREIIATNDLIHQEMQKVIQNQNS